MRIWTAALAATVLATGFGAAQAHPKLLTSNPAAGARLRAPAVVRLSFSETLIPKFCKIALAGPSGAPVRLGPSTVSADRKQLAAAIQQKLGPGAYKVSWQAVSTDTHHVHGGYAFTVTP